MKEVENVTFGYWGFELPEWQAIQILWKAGFHYPPVLLVMFAIIEGESGSFSKAWHANIVRDANGDAMLDAEGNMEIKSIDLGFIQRNVDVIPNAKVLPTVSAMEEFVNQKFEEHPELANPHEAASEAHDLYSQRGFTPWFAYKPGTLGFKLKKRRGCKAIANALARTQVGKMDVDGGSYPHLDFDSEV